MPANKERLLFGVSFVVGIWSDNGKRDCWPGHVIKDMKANCRGADFMHEMQIKFDSMGKDHLETPENVIHEWIEAIKSDIR